MLRGQRRRGKTTERGWGGAILLLQAPVVRHPTHPGLDRGAGMLPGLDQGGGDAPGTGSGGVGMLPGDDPRECCQRMLPGIPDAAEGGGVRAEVGGRAESLLLQLWQPGQVPLGVRKSRPGQPPWAPGPARPQVTYNRRGARRGGGAEVSMGMCGMRSLACFSSRHRSPGRRGSAPSAPLPAASRPPAPGAEWHLPGAAPAQRREGMRGGNVGWTGGSTACAGLVPCMSLTP